MRISDWSSDVCSSDLANLALRIVVWRHLRGRQHLDAVDLEGRRAPFGRHQLDQRVREPRGGREAIFVPVVDRSILAAFGVCICAPIPLPMLGAGLDAARSEEHTSELQSLMRTSYAVFCL